MIAVVVGTVDIALMVYVHQHVKLTQIVVVTGNAMHTLALGNVVRTITVCTFR